MQNSSTTHLYISIYMSIDKNIATYCFKLKLYFVIIVDLQAAVRNNAESSHVPITQCFAVVTSYLLSHFSHVRVCATPQTAAHQASLSLGLSRQEHWSGLPFPSPMHESEK